MTTIVGAVPRDLSFEALTGLWHNGVLVDGEPARPLTAAEDALEQDLQTDVFWRPEWEERYGVWGHVIGHQVPRGLMIGSWQVVARNGRGEVTCRWRSAKIITTAGKTAVANYLATASPAVTPFFKYLGTGTSNTAPAVGDVAMGGSGATNTEVPSAASSQRLLGTASNSTNVYQVQGTTATSVYSGQTIQEAGMFNSATAQTTNGVTQGTMYDRSLLSPSAVMASTDTLQMTFQITFS